MTHKNVQLARHTRLSSTYGSLRYLAIARLSCLILRTNIVQFYRNVRKSVLLLCLIVLI